MKQLSQISPPDAEIAKLRRKVRGLSREIAWTENLMDTGIRTLESAKRERDRVQEQIDRLILQDAVNYPSVIGA